MDTDDIKYRDTEGFTRKGDPVGELIAGGMLGVCMAGLLSVVSAPAASPLIKSALISFAVALPYWGMIFFAFRFQVHHGLGETPDVLGGCLSVVITLVTVWGLASLFAQVWLPGGGVFLGCCILAWLLSFRYFRRKERVSGGEL